MPIIFDPAAPDIPAVTTFDDVIEEVTSNLQGYTAATDQVTYLTSTCGVSDLGVTVADASILSRGIIEIDTELMWVTQSSPGAQSFTILPAGRGWRGTVAAIHPTGTTVTAAPAVPRFIVRREIVNQINSLYPGVYSVNSMEFTYNNVLQIGWPLPAEAADVLDVRWKDYNGNWQRIRTWELENGADTTDFPTGVTIRFHGIPQGRTVQVVYATIPTVPVSDTDLFSTTGLSAGAKDLVVLGTMARIVPMMDVSRLTVAYVPVEEMSQNRPAGGALAVGKYLEAKYAMRLQQERAILNSNFPARVHFTR
jgi:hypothetical protein